MKKSVFIKNINYIKKIRKPQNLSSCHQFLMSTNLSHSNKEIYWECSFDKATISPTTKDLSYENMLPLFIFYGHACMCVLFRGECDLFLQVTLHLTFQDMVSY